MLFLCRRKGSPPTEGRADHGAGALIASRGTRRPWAGALIASRGTRQPWAGALVAARGTRRPWAGALIASRGTRRPWGGRAYCSSAAAELAETFFRSCPWAGRAKQVIRSAAARAEQENTARSKAYRAFARRKRGKAGVAIFLEGLTEVHSDDTIMAGSTLLPVYAIETKRAAIFSLFSSMQGAAYAPIFYVRIRRNFPLPKRRGVRALVFL